MSTAGTGRRRAKRATATGPGIVRPAGLEPPFTAGRAMSGAVAAALTTGLPLIWTASLVWMRIRQLARLAEGQSMDAEAWKTWQDSALADRAMAACGMLRLDWKIQGFNVKAGRMVTMRPRPVIPCPRCRVPAWRLIAKDGTWHCRRCWGSGKVDGWKQAGMTNFQRTEILLGDYACGLRIGLTGQSMLKRRKFLLRRLRTRHLMHGRSATDLYLLSIGGPLLRPNPTWERTKQGHVSLLRNLSPLWPRLAAQIVPTAVEHLLHPDAYLTRFGGPQWRPPAA